MAAAKKEKATAMNDPKNAAPAKQKRPLPVKHKKGESPKVAQAAKAEQADPKAKKEPKEEKVPKITASDHKVHYMYKQARTVCRLKKDTEAQAKADQIVLDFNEKKLDVTAANKALLAVIHSAL